MHGPELSRKFVFPRAAHPAGFAVATASAHWASSEIKLHGPLCPRIVRGMSERTADSFSSHQACRQRKWYFEGEGRDDCARLDGYGAVANPHQTFHQRGKDAVSAFHAGELLRGMELVAGMEADSMKVLAALERIALAGAGEVGASAARKG